MTREEIKANQQPFIKSVIWEKIVLSGLVTAGYSGYFLINNWSISNKFQGNVPAFWLDHIIPYMPIWIYVYAIIFMSVFLPLLVVRNRWLFRRVVLAFFVVEVLSYIVFMAYPVQYIYRHPTMTTDTFVGWGMQMTYWLDQPYCCLPSMHVSMATLSALVVWKVDRIIGGITLVIAFLIGLSTMFIKQHYFVDMIGGFAVASLGYWLFVANFKTADIPVHELRYARRWSLLLPALYIAAIAVLYVAYRMGWQPWATA